MKNVDRDINGIRVVLAADSEDCSFKGRLGSVPVVFENGERRLIRIYGNLKHLTARAERVEFEKAIRKECEDPALLNELFGDVGMKPSARRFNPSERLNGGGWKCNFALVRAC